jgi:hypothetical protein
LGACGWFGLAICDGAKIGLLALEAKKIREINDQYAVAGCFRPILVTVK